MTETKVKDPKLAKLEFELGRKYALKDAERVAILRSIEREDYVEAMLRLLENLR